MINIIFKIIVLQGDSCDKPSEFFDQILGKDIYDKLMKYKPYIYAMESLAKENSSKVYSCVICNNRTFSLDEDYCYCCNFINVDFNLIYCECCNEKRSVIYDNLNIELNHNIMPGLCLNCGERSNVFQCSVCEMAHNIEANIGNHLVCSEEKCINA